MKNWYQCKVKYAEENEEGILKQGSHLYLFDAVSYGDAEARTYENMDMIVSGEFSIGTITKTNLIEVVNIYDEERWYKAKVSYSTVDGDSEKEVKVNNHILVSAEDVEGAAANIHEAYKSMLVPYTIKSLSDTNIEQVFPTQVKK